MNDMTAREARDKYGELDDGYVSCYNCPLCDDCDSIGMSGYSDCWKKIAKKMTERAPIIEAAHGSWVMRGGKLYCSECGKLALRDQDRDDWWYYVQSDFCPNCGADMREGGAE